MMDIVEDMMPSNFFAASSIATYIRYIVVCIVMFKHRGILILLVKPKRDAPATKTLSITQFGDPNLYISSEKNIFYIIQAANLFVTNDYRRASFQTNCF